MIVTHSQFYRKTSNVKYTMDKPWIEMNAEATQFVSLYTSYSHNSN
jgi:hypothetical protein